MIKKLNKLPFKLPLVLMGIVLVSISILAFEPNKGPKFRSDPYMVSIPGGSFYMGPDLSQATRPETIIIEANTALKLCSSSIKFPSFLN